MQIACGSRTAEHALRAMVYLSLRSPETCTTSEIAAATHVPKPYLSKVLQLLARSRLIESHRGVRGGINLAKSPDQTTMHEIIAAVDPKSRARARAASSQQAEPPWRDIHREIGNVIEMVDRAFETITLVQLAESRLQKFLTESPEKTIAQG